MTLHPPSGPPIEASESTPSLTIVIPAYNEADAIAETLAELGEVLLCRQYLHDRVEVVIVSDGSTDNTYEIATEALSTAGLKGYVVELAHNTGSHAALLCGIRHSSCDFVAYMAADGQDPPCCVLALYDELSHGYDVVWGLRASRKQDPLLRRVTARFYYRVFRLITRLNYPPAGIDVFICRKQVADIVSKYLPRNSSIFLYIFNLPLRSGTITYARRERVSGNSKWTLGKRFTLAINMFTGLSPAPIRLMSVLGGTLGLLGMVFGGTTIARSLLTDSSVPGWSSLMVVVSLMCGLILILLGLVGEYLWRVLDNTRLQPEYFESRNSLVDGGTSTSSL
ncbi:glycosyltransferase family 2 protein [bacterium]|nr:glycosyltransferase family 2 protein [bacterium]